MKNLKFRTWKNGKMVYSDEFNMFYEFFEQACLDPDDAMMSSGVIDRNGKEIYEGDIVKYCMFVENGVEEWKTGTGVVFERGCFWIGSRRANNMNISSPNYIAGEPALMLWQSPKWLEVIGNIFEI